jgi:phospholipid-binding lipoprotein MlaA
VNIDLSPRVAVRAGGAVVVLVSLALGSCATPPADPAARVEFEQTNDPLEPLNRKTFALNEFLDHAVFRPGAKVYVAVVPEDARKAIHRVLDNMKEPTLFFNNMLQGEFKRAEITLGRFLVNSTVGFGGMVDVMTLSGIERQPADFGQTLYVWGVGSGPYLILPILGPTNPRDAIGSTVDSYADPFTILANDHGVTELTTSRLVVGGIEERARVLDVLDDLEKNSVDFYAQMRSLTQQHREAELRHGKAPDTVPGLYDDPDQGAPPSTSPSPARPGAATGGVQQTAALPTASPRPRPMATSRAPAKPGPAASAAKQAAPVEPDARSAAIPSPSSPAAVILAGATNGTRQTAMAPPTTSGLDFDENPFR